MRDLDLGGFYAPPLAMIFAASFFLMWLIDLIVAPTGVYRFVWHPSLFRASLFACVFGGAALCFYR